MSKSLRHSVYDYAIVLEKPGKYFTWYWNVYFKDNEHPTWGRAWSRERALKKAKKFIDNEVERHHEDVYLKYSDVQEKLNEQK